MQVDAVVKLVRMLDKIVVIKVSVSMPMIGRTN